MSSRARIFAAVTFLISCTIGPAAWAQAQNLEAGKSPSQLFAGTCSACHKSPRGLLKTVAPGALTGFLKEHYTTGGEMASQLATYLISNGASDNRQSKQGADKQGQGGNDLAEHQGRKNRNTPSQEAARPDDTLPGAEGGRQGRKRQARPAESPEEGKPVADAPAQTEPERATDGRRLSAKQRKKPGKPPAAEEPSMANEPAGTEPSKTEPSKTESAKTEPGKMESGTDDKAKAEPRQETGNAAAKPDAEMKPRDELKSAPAKSETAKTEVPADSSAGDKPAMRRDPVPAATAPPAAVATPVPAVAAGAASEPTASQAPAPKAAEPQAVTASAPPPPRPAGPPAPPISQ